MEKGSLKEAKTEETTEEKVVRFGDQINFNELFRVKEKKGLFTLASKVHKSGMIKMIRFLDPTETVVVNENKLVCLGHLQFQTELGFGEGGKVIMGEVFSNLHEFYSSEEYKENPELVPGLEVFVPQYDKNLFKERHAAQVLGWFDEVITKITELDVKEDIKKED